MATNAKPPNIKLSFAPATKYTLTRWEKLGLIVVMAKMLASFPFILLSILLRKRTKFSKTWQHELRNTLFRFNLSRISARQINASLPPSTEAATQFTKKFKITLSTDVIQHGAKLHWFGERKGEKAIVHIHGGGYNLPLSSYHMLYLWRTQKRLQQKRVHVDVAFLEYSLTPTARYPTQLTQAVESLRHLLAQGYDPANIIFSGDSAGGCLVISLISHILHPHPSILPLKLPETSPKLAGLVPISPWTTFSKDYPSFTESYNKDIIFNHLVDTWSRWYVDRPDEARHPELPALSAEQAMTAPGWDVYNQPGTAEPSWWNGFPVKKTLVLIGDDELLRDAVVEWTGKLVEGAGPEADVRVVKCEGEIHEECLYDMLLKQQPGKMAQTGWSFFEEVFGATKAD